MKKVIRLTESDLTRVVKRVVEEAKKEKITLSDYFDDVIDSLKKRFDLTSKEVDEIIEHYRDDIEMGFYDGDSVKTVVNSWVKDGKLKWKR